MLNNCAMLLSIFLLSLFDFALAVPFTKRAGVTPVPPLTIASYDAYTQMARAAYRAGFGIWACGPACDAVPGVIPYGEGGDGKATPYWFVGYWGGNDSVIIVHQGTVDKVAWLVNLNMTKDFMDATQFPDVPSSVQVHSGFHTAFGRSITPITTAVNKALEEHDTDRLTIVGHSLGGALSLLDSVYFHIQMPWLTIKTVTYGAPRVGNLAFVDYVKDFDLIRITNRLDPVPTVPGPVLGFHHAHGEIHVNDTGHWNYCDGQDNPDTQCRAGQTVLDVLDIALPAVLKQYHSGPYNGVMM